MTVSFRKYRCGNWGALWTSSLLLFEDLLVPCPCPWSPVMLWIRPPQLCKSVTNVTRLSPVPAEWGRQGSASFRPQPPPALITDKSVSKGKTRKVKGDTQHRGEDVKVVLQNVSIVRSHPSPLEEAETGAARVTRVSSYIYRGALGPGSWHLFIRQQFQCFMFHYQPNCIGMIFPNWLSPKSVFQTVSNIWWVCHDWRFTRRSFG